MTANASLIKAGTPICFDASNEKAVIVVDESCIFESVNCLSDRL